MPVVFEDENFNFSRGGVTAATNNAGATNAGNPFTPAAETSNAKRVMMIIFAIVCIGLAFYIPSIINPSKKQAQVYLEDITEARMRLIPEKDQAEYVSRLPSRSVGQ